MDQHAELLSNPGSIRKFYPKIMVVPANFLAVFSLASQLPNLNLFHLIIIFPF